jgi:2-keto-4-pentenoate hydratase/2-oxohepta-3-ene-1,7-dioic acid hydratase in catechol pathway
MGVEVGDRVTVLAPLEEFYADVHGWLAEAAQIVEGDRLLADTVAAVPVPPTAKVLCVALNYDLHAEESGGQVPEVPNFFARWWATLVTTGITVPVPAAEPGLDWEVELAVVVGETLTAVTADELRNGARPGAILGYTVFNDISAREHQRATSQWANGKNADQSGPISSTIVTADALDPSDLHLTTTVNDQVMQSGTTADMVHKIPELLAYATRTITLRPGDLIATGTPAGVGFKRNPPVLLHPGDVVTVEVEGVGAVQSPVVNASYRH